MWPFFTVHVGFHIPVPWILWDITNTTSTHGVSGFITHRINHHHPFRIDQSDWYKNASIFCIQINWPNAGEYLEAVRKSRLYFWPFLTPDPKGQAHSLDCQNKGHLGSRYLCTLPETNIAHENLLFPRKYHQNCGFSMAMLVYRSVYIYI